MLHKFKLGIRRKWRAQKKQVSGAAEQSGDNFERYFIQRLGKFSKVWRPVFSWTLLFVLIIGCLIAQNSALSAYYQTRQPVAGGVYNEAILGSFSNANPVYATGRVDASVSRLIFAGLFKYDDNNRLVGDLAKSWSVDKTGKIYTVKLREGLRWHDGHPLTSQDVVYTYRVIQNPDAASPLRNNWAGIVVTVADDHTVLFKLPNPLSSFIYGATNGIIPKHILKDVPMASMRSVSFNTKSPVGSGPFKWRNIDVQGTADRAHESIGLTANKYYWAGSPKLKAFVVHAFTNKDDMIKAYNREELTAMSGLLAVPEGMDAKQTTTYNFPLTAETMVFFKNSQAPLDSAAIRQALVAASDPTEVVDKLAYSARPVHEPLLKSQLGYDPRYTQKTAQQAAAAKALDDSGWVMGTNGVRSLNGKPLQFNLTVADTAEYRAVADTLKSQWAEIGVRVVIDVLDAGSFRDSLANHTYDAILYGIGIGSDPDVYVYWHSTQADVRSVERLNLSEYKSTVSDDALDAGRTRNESAIRIIKYQGFLKQWQADAPALALYQPRYLYITHQKVYNLNEHTINAPADRLYSVNNWMIRTARVTNP